VLRLLAHELQLPVVLTGSAAEGELVDEIRVRRAMPAAFAGRTAELGELGAALRLATVA
jgi:hypothetical protein